jgi:hypothetical protein
MKISVIKLNLFFKINNNNNLEKLYFPLMKRNQSSNCSSTYEMFVWVELF